MKLATIPLTKVSTKWPPIRYVDAAFEVPQDNRVYLLQGKVEQFVTFSTAKI